MADAVCTAHYQGMNPSELSQQQNQNPTGASFAEAADFHQDGIAFKPSAGDVARRAYIHYQNQGSQHGQDVQHWLAAETELSAERDRA